MRRATPFAAVVVAAAWLGLSACASARLPKMPGDPAPAFDDDAAERGYQAVLEKWTRSGAIYDHLDTRLFVQATLQSTPFVDTRLKRWATFKLVPPDELEQERKREYDRLGGVTEFFVGVHANESRMDDLDRANSMWRIVLVADGKDLAPLSVERLGRTSVEMRSVYSYMESFWTGYRVRFPRAAAGGPVTLRLASAVGHADLDFAQE